MSQVSPAISLVDIGGRRLRCSVTGSGPTVLLDSGGSGAGVGTWAAGLTERLAEFATVVTYDRAGVGESDPGPLPRTVERMAADLHLLVHRLKVSLPAVFAGWSYGGLVVTQFAAEHPADVAGLVYIDPTPTERAPCLRLGGLWQRSLFALGTTGLAQTRPGATAARYLARQGAADEKEVAGLVQFLQNREVVKTESRLLSVHARNVRQVERTLAVSALPPVPLTVVSAGLRSPTRKGRQLARWMLESHTRLAARSPEGSVVIAARATHQVPADEPDAIVDAVRAALRARS